MAKKRKPTRSSRASRKQLNERQGQGQRTSTELLRVFKRLWASEAWIQALSTYREWTNKAGRKRDALIEGELLYRIASGYFQDGDYAHSIEALVEAKKRDPERSGRYLWSLGIVLTRQGEMAAGLEVFSEIKDEYHSGLLSALIDMNGSVQPVSGYPIMDRSELLTFWRDLDNTPSVQIPALEKLSDSYQSVKTGVGDPERPIRLLSQKEGYRRISTHLLLLLSVRDRNTVKFRNLLRNRLEYMDDESASTLIETHLVLLLGEANYSELQYLCGLIRELDLEPTMLPMLENELSFQLALREIDTGRWEKALEFIDRIDTDTPQVLHNRALINQKLERYAEANRNWIRLLQNEKKPKRTDPSEKKASYAVALTCVGENFLEEERFEDAYSYYREALDLTPDDPEALEAIMMIADNLGRHAEMLHYAQKLFDISPENMEYFFSITMALAKLGRSEELVSFCEQWLEGHPENTINPIMEKLLSSLYRKSAWTLRHDQPEKARALFEKSGDAPAFTPEDTYLRGFFFMEDGKSREAEIEFKKAVEATDDHYDELHLAIAFYEDGMEDQASDLFDDIVACDCFESEDIFVEEIIPFLVGKDDFERMRRHCELALNEGEDLLWQIADQLLSLGKPDWARLYSTRLINDRYGVDADADNLFLHLIILNKTGAWEEAVKTANALLDDARRNDDQWSVKDYQRIIKELTTRKWAKIDYVAE